MEVIIRNGENFSLTNIPNDELELVKNNNEEVIIDFNLTDTDKLKIYNGCILNADLTVTETEEYINKIKKEQLDKINQDFENKIKEYNSKYTQEEQKRFADKLRKAEIVIAGGSDYYIEEIAKSKGVEPLDIANLIKQKADEFEAFYTQAEIDRDNAIANLQNNI